MSAVLVETESSWPLAVVYRGGTLGADLVSLLEKQELSVRHLTGDDTSLTIFDHPTYLYYFASEATPLATLKNELQDALSSAAQNKSRIVLIFNNLPSDAKAVLRETVSASGWKTTEVEIEGHLTKGPEHYQESLGKIARLAFSSRHNEPLIIKGSTTPTLITSNHPPEVTRHLSTEEVLSRLEALSHRHHRRLPSVSIRLNRRIALPLLVTTLFLLLLVLPLLSVLLLSIFGWKSLDNSRAHLVQGQYQVARLDASEAKSSFVLAESLLRLLSPLSLTGLPLEKYYAALSLGESIADSAGNAASLMPELSRLPKIVLGEESDAALPENINAIRIELSAIDQNLGLAQAGLTDVLNPNIIKIIGFIGIPPGKLSAASDKISDVRHLIGKTNALLSVLPAVLTEKGRRAYLVVFQNPTELRPTGGFIGSYAVIHVDQGKILDYKINDIYTADGQLRGRIEPPDEILHFLGQPNWYLRDANFSPDFPLTARRLKWFFEKETGQSVDGVIAVDLGAVQKILQATGPLTLSAGGEVVTSDNFFQKAEFAAEINFFPGSNQKRDYLGLVAGAILDKITTDPHKDWVTLGKAFKDSLDEKNILFYFDSPALEQMVKDNSWAGSLTPPACSLTKSNCLMVVDSNFGANKANYFLKRHYQISAVVGKGGGTEVNVKIDYQNDSPSQSWPGGRYKNYLRFLIPNGSRLARMDLGDNRTATLSSILTAAVLSKVQPSQFLIFQTNELSLGANDSTASAFQSFGSLFELPIQTSRTVSFTYRPLYQLDFTRPTMTYLFNLQKQPGTGPDPVDFILDFPSFLAPINPPAGSLVFPQRLVYNTNLSIDRSFEFKFQKQ